jgi:hypothetical protein
MELLKEKKISFIITLFSILMLLFGLITKNFNGNYDLKQYTFESPPLIWFEVYVFGISFNYLNFLLFFTITLGIGIYFLVYKDDNEIKSYIKKPVFFEKLLNKYYEFERKSLITTVPIETEVVDKTLSIVQIITVFALLFTFFMSFKFGFSLWFFIILAYYHYISLNSISKKQIIIKSISYPLIFLIIISAIQSSKGEDIMGYRFERPITFYLGLHLIGYFLCVLIMLFTLLKRFKSPPKFSYTYPLFWLSSICLIISVFRFVFS